MLVTAATAAALGGSASAQNPVLGWGRSDQGQSVAPTIVGQVTQLAGGMGHSAALNSFRGLAMWGSNEFGQCAVPSAEGYSAVALGGWHTVAISGSRVLCWGRNHVGQCNAPAWLEGVVAIGAGAVHSMAITNDRRVHCWGYGSVGCAPDSVQEHAVAVDGGYEHSVALLDDGTVGAWGDNGFGQCSIPKGITDVVAVAAGDYFTLALRASGTVRAWGDNSSGQCDVPGWINSVTRIDAGADHVVALRSDGTVFAWGGNSSGQCLPPSGLSRVTTIAAGGGHSLAAQPPLPPSGSPWVATVGVGGGAGFRSIQQAIDAAPRDRPALIQVRPGTYTADTHAVVTIVDRSVELVSTDGPGATVIEGGDARRGILCLSGYGASLKVRGFTFSRCRGQPLGHPYNLNGYGGGIRADHAPELIVDDCRFLDCTAPPATPGTYYYGSGIWYQGIRSAPDGSPPTPPPPPFRVSNCLFERCERSGLGIDACGATVQSSVFRHCRLGWGAALLSSDGIRIDGCTFDSNEGGPLGGAASILWGAGQSTVTNCLFSGNIGSHGGGMFMWRSLPGPPVQRSRIAHCTFVSNVSIASGGGALHGCTATDIEHCTFVGNTGLYGRALHGSTWQPPHLVGCTFDTCCPFWPLNGATLGSGNAFEPRCIECAGDLECDGLVDGKDLGILLAKWGSVPPGDTADVNADGFVDGTDLGELLATWGVCPQS